MNFTSRLIDWNTQQKGYYLGCFVVFILTLINDCCTFEFKIIIDYRDDNK